MDQWCVYQQELRPDDHLARRTVRPWYYARPGYYWGYENPKFNDLFTQIQNSPRPADRSKLLGDAQRMLANDAVNGFLFQPQWITIANKNVKGLWKDMPIFANDLSTLSWT